jgi:hypothetical protein
LKLNSKKNELELKNTEKENLIIEEQKAIEENDFEKADHIETSITKLSEKIEEINNNIEEYIKNVMKSRSNEISLMKNSLNDFDNISKDYLKLKENVEETINKFNNNEMVKHKTEELRLEKMFHKLEFLKSNLDIEKSTIDSDENKIMDKIKEQSAGIFEDLDNLNKDKNELNDEIEK